jgi:hypothetical protein
MGRRGLGNFTLNRPLLITLLRLRAAWRLVVGRRGGQFFFKKRETNIIEVTRDDNRLVGTTQCVKQTLVPT